MDREKEQAPQCRGFVFFVWASEDVRMARWLLWLAPKDS
jgi:hypothetical protein